MSTTYYSRAKSTPQIPLPARNRAGGSTSGTSSCRKVGNSFPGKNIIHYTQTNARDFDIYTTNGAVKDCHPGYDTVPFHPPTTGLTSDGMSSRRFRGQVICVKNEEFPPQISPRGKKLKRDCVDEKVTSRAGFSLNASSVSQLSTHRGLYDSSQPTPASAPYSSGGIDLPPNYEYNASRRYISRAIDYDGTGISRKWDENLSRKGSVKNDISSIVYRPTNVSLQNGDFRGRGRVYDTHTSIEGGGE